MIKKFPIVAAILCLGRCVSAEPLLMETASRVVAPGGLEVGLESRCGENKYVVEGQPGATWSQSSGQDGLFVRYGLSGKSELRLELPYGWWRLKISQNGSALLQKESGFGDLIGTYKTRFWGSGEGWNGAVKADVIFPTGEEEKGLGQGFGAEPGVMFGWSGVPCAVDSYVGYRWTGEYRPYGVRHNPSDVVTYGLSTRFGNDVWAVLAEAWGESFDTESKGGRRLEGTSGRRAMVIPGVRLRYGNIKFKAGYGLSVGPVRYRDEDWRVLFGVSWVGRASFTLRD
ncbi:MAG TPA: transporter [Elusimicrobiota bacterium]|nr:transporter [Elusimicrobiota bacterium]